MKAVGHYLSGNSLRFFKQQIKIAQKSPYGRRWSAHDKSIALSLFHASPKAYKLLSELFIMPTTETLNKAVRNLEIYPGISSHIVSAFKSKVASFDESEKLCVVSFDEVKLKPGLVYDPRRDNVEGVQDMGNLLGKQNLVADYAIVFYVRGLVSKWKQPYCYYVTSSTVKGDKLALLIKEVLTSLIDLGLFPTAMVCDQGSNNRSCMSRSFHVTSKEPWFIFNGHKIVCFYDSPHLLKNIRTNLKDSGFISSGHLIQFEHIRQFYLQDTKLPIRQAPKLTEKHFNLKRFMAMNVRLAAQILSHSVAKGVTLCTSFGALPMQAQHTADFCDFFDCLFNIFNSRMFKSHRRFNSGIRANMKDYWEFLDKAEVYLKNLRSPNHKSLLPCVEGWLQNISALKLLFALVKQPVILSYRLNQDCVENFFSKIRGMGGHRDHPTCTEFRAAFRNVQLDALTSTSKSSNCEDVGENIEKLLFGLGSFEACRSLPLSDTSESDEQPSSSNSPAVHIPDHQYSFCFPQQENNILHMQKQNILAYIGGFIVRKVEQLVCPECAKCLVAQSDLPFHQLINLKNYVPIPGKGLRKPSRVLVNLLEEAEDCFNGNIDSCIRHKNVKMTLHKLIIARCAQKLTCDCKAKQAVIRYYVNIRLHFALKLYNDFLCENAEKRKSRKHIKLSS